MARATVRDVIAVVEAAYPPHLAADWDAIGLTCGDPDAEVRRILLAVDPVSVVVDEAIGMQADLLITHHPLFLTGVHSVAAVDAKGSVVHRLISHGIALLTAHTNADHAEAGVSDALAAALGVRDLRPLAPLPDAPDLGTGRIGTLDGDVTLEQFAEHVATVLPATKHGVRVAGDPQASVRTVAVCGGSGDSLLAEAGGQADVYVTSDLRHHRVLDHLADAGCPVIDIAHWAGEWPWLSFAARAIADGLATRGVTVEIEISEIPTDPWTAHRGSQP
jgi:dinuclear metal center YbgI/SA1388 family protein